MTPSLSGAPAPAPAPGAEQTLAMLRIENAGLRARIGELEARAAEPDAVRAELEEARRRNEEMRSDRRVLDREVVELRSLLAEAERQLAGVRQTFIWRIGEAIVSARGWKGLRQLPRRLIALRRAFLEKRAHAVALHAADTRKLADRLRHVEEALGVLARDGPAAAIAHVRGLPERQAEEKARALVEVALAIRAAEPTLAADLGVEAAGLNAAEPRLRALVLGLFDDGALEGPGRVIEAAGEGLMARPADLARKAAILAQRRQLRAPLAFPAPAASPPATGRRLAVIGQRSLPQHADAATFRAQAVLDAARGQGWETVLVTAPGYQYPKAADGEPVQRLVGAEPVLRLPTSDAPADAYDAFIAETGATMAAAFLRRRITHVHAMAGAPLAAAALWGARRAGARFTLDVGAAPTPADWPRPGAESERMRAHLSLFQTVAQEAERVVVRAASLGDHLAGAGLVAGFERIEDAAPPTFVRADIASIGDIRRELGLGGQVLIGVFDTLDFDEGLADLVRALPEVRRVQPDAAVLFCGSGKGAQPLLQLAARLGVAEHVIVPSGFVRQRTPDYLSAFAVAAFPKRRGRLAEVAAPFELQAAMAVAAPIVAADNRWTDGWIVDGETGLLVQPGDPGALAASILRLLEDRSLAEALGRGARMALDRRADRRRVDQAIIAALEGGPAARSAA